MLPPHWLDDVFQYPDQAISKLTASGRFKEAIARAQAAYYEREAFQKQNPQVVGGSPAQEARIAFLAAISLN